MFIVPITRMPEVGSLEQISKQGEVSVQKTNKNSFEKILSQAVKEADEAQKASDSADELLASGSVDDLHTAMIQAEQATAAIEFTTQLTSKAVSAYNQIMGMQV